ncbi:MAG: extracellular solute-binding protein [Castellaniella sp.]|uniref:ABC transporter substrate-binding protein n=1 Tax=Castellaniella sp. TaxID=1955812 RepID=UPI0012206646|nr:extracellular solute-binding protein [Castellaniella sp.]TAN31624.1 MAG: extracellular solute-binding protein [Castellaniella sp.]
MNKISRRQFVYGSAALLLQSRLAWAADKRSIVVGTWGGDFGRLLKDNVDGPLMAPQGIEVTQSIANAATRRAKLLAERQLRRGSMDVVCLADFDMFAGFQAGALEPITPKHVSRLDKVLPFLKTSYSIPHIYSAHVLVYNTEKVKEKPKSFADLWDPRYKGRVGLVDALFPTNTVIAAIVGGGSPTNIAPAAAKLRELHALRAKVYPSQEALGIGLKAGETWIAITAAARSYMWHKAGIPLAFSVPSEGGFPATYEAGVPKNASHKAEGYKYLDAMLEPSAQLAFAAKMGYLPCVSDAKLPPDLDAAIGFTQAEQDRMLKINLDYLTKEHASILDTWMKIFFKA